LLAILVVFFIPNFVHAMYNGASPFDSQIRYSWTEISNTGTNTGMTSTSEQFTAPIGFTFDFFGTDYTELNISSFGYATFGDSPWNSTNRNITNATTPNNFIAPFWDNLNYTTSSNIYYQTFGTAPKRYFVVEWYNMTHTNDASTTKVITFQMVLYENTSSVIFNYKDVRFGDGTGTYDHGGDATVGTENAAGDNGFLVFYNQKQISNEDTILIYDDGNCTVPQNSQSLSSSVTYCPGYYAVNSSLTSPVFTFNVDDITMDCDNSIFFGNGSSRGVNLVNRDNVALKSCTLVNYTYGAYSMSAGTENVSIESNKFFNSSYGFYINPTGAARNNHTFFNNTFGSNGVGVYLRNIENSTFINNTFRSQSSYALDLQFNAEYNSISGNIFISNNPGSDQVNNDDVTNLFNASTIGNYWSDYDEESEGCYDNQQPGGFCDNQFNISGSGNSADYLASTYQFGTCTVPYDDFAPTADVTFCKGGFHLTDGGSSGVLRLTNSNVIVTCSETRFIGPGSGIFVTSSLTNNFTLSGCTAANYSYGISSDANNFTVINNLFTNISSIATQITAEDASIINNTYLNNAQGVYLWGNTSIIVNNSFTDHSNVGISIVTGSSNNTITGNSFINGAVADVFSDGTDNIFNTSTYGNYWGDYDEESEGCFDDINPGGICDSFLPDALIGGSDSGTDYLPTLYQPGTCTIPLDDYAPTADVTLCRGRYAFGDFGPAGIIQLNTPGITITCDGTIIRGTGSGGGRAFNGDASNVVIQGCGMENIQYGVFGVDYENRTIRNNVFSGLDVGVYSSVSAEPTVNNQTIFNNSFTNMDTAGLYSTFTVNHSITNNTFNNNTQAAVFYFSSGDSFVYGNSFIDAAFSGFGTSGTITFNTSTYGNYWSDYDEESEGCYDDVQPGGICDDNNTLNLGGTDYYDSLPTLYQFGTCTVPVDDLTPTRDVTLCKGRYTINDGSNDGVIKLDNEGVNVICDETVIVGSSVPPSYSGSAFRGNADNTLIQGCNIQFYQYGVYGDDFENRTIQSNVFLNNQIGVYSSASGEPASINQTILNNTFTNASTTAAYLTNTINSSIINNTIQNSVQGLTFYFNVGDNQVHGNNFLNATVAGFGPTGSMSFNTSTYGNYWDDYDEEAEGCYDYQPLGGVCDANKTLDIGGTDFPDFLPTLYQFGTCTVPVEDLSITTNVTLCKGRYWLSDPTANGAIRIKEENVTVSCDGTAFFGAGAEGQGVEIDGINNVIVDSCTFINYSYGIYNTFDGTESKTFRNLVFINNTNYSIYVDENNTKIYNSTFIVLSNTTGVVYTSNANGGNFSGNTFNVSGGDGVLIEGANLVIQDNLFNFVAGFGINFSDASVINVNITNNTINILNSVSGQIIKAHGTNIVINNNRINGGFLSNGTFLMVDNASAPLIENNFLNSTNNTYIMHLTDVADAIIRNNTLLMAGTASYGAYLEFPQTQRNVISNNTILNDGTFSKGIEILSHNNTCSNNEINITNSYSNGFFFTGIPDPQSNNITSNTVNVLNSTSSGFFLDEGYLNVFDNNTIYTIGTGLNLVFGADNNIIKNNTITSIGAAGSGIQNSANSTQIYGNYINRSGEFGAGIQILPGSFFNTVYDNTIDVSGLNAEGMALSGNNNTIYSNTLTATTLNLDPVTAIRLFDADYNNLSNNNFSASGSSAFALIIAPNSTQNTFTNNVVLGESILIAQAATSPPPFEALVNTLSGTTISMTGPNGPKLSGEVSNSIMYLYNTTFLSFGSSSTAIFYPYFNISLGPLLADQLVIKDYLVALNVTNSNVTLALNTTAEIRLNEIVDCSNFTIFKTANFTNDLVTFNTTTYAIATAGNVGGDCLNNECTDLRCDSGQVRFNVSSFSSYGVQNGTTIDAPITFDNHTANYSGVLPGSYWFNSAVYVQLNASGLDLNYTEYCSYNMNSPQCSSFTRINATTNPFTTNVFLDCDSPNTVCQYYIRYKSGTTSGPVETAHNSLLVNVLNGVDIQNASLNLTTVEAGCYIRNSTLFNSSLLHDSSYAYPCYILDSVVENATLAGVKIVNSTVTQTESTESLVINSIIADSSVQYSRVVEATFCGAFNVSGAFIEKDILHSGSIGFNGSTYYAPFNISKICGNILPIPQGTLTATPSITKGNQQVNFTHYRTSTGYFGVDTGYTVQLNLTPLNNTIINLTDADGDSYYTNSFTFGSLARGTYELNGSVNDGVGNNWTIRVNVTVDTTVPTISISLAGGDVYTNSQLASINLTYSDDVAVDQCKYGINAGNYSDWLSCETSKVIDLTSGDGLKSYFVLIKDTAGNNASGSDTITLDSTLPLLNITSPVKGSTINGTVNITFTGSENSTFISIDGADYVLTTTNTSYLWDTSTLTNGAHAVKLKETDLANNLGYSEQVIYQIDNAAPIGVLTSNVSVVKNGTNITFTYSAYETGLTATLNVTEISTPSTILTLTDTENNGIYIATFIANSTATGTKDLYLEATDGSNTYTETLSLYLDNTLPSGTINIIPPGVFGYNTTNTSVTHSRTVTLNLSYSDNYQISTCAYSNNNLTYTEYESCSQTKSWILTANNGLKTVYYRMKDSAGNVNTTSATITLDSTGQGSDATAPNPPSVFDAGVYTNVNHSLYISWNNASDPESALLNYDLTYEYRIYNFSNSSFITSWVSAGTNTNVNITSLNLAEGYNYSVFIRVTNAAGLTSNSSSNGIVVDTQAPTLTINSSTHPTQSSYYSGTTATFSLNGSDDTSEIQGFSYMIDGTNGTGPDFSLETTPAESLVSYKNAGTSIPVLNSSYSRTIYQHINTTNISSGDTLTVEFALAEQTTDTIDTSTFQVYVCNDTTYNCSTQISNTATFSRDVPFVSDLTKATHYRTTLTINASSSSFYVGIKPINATSNTLMFPTSSTTDALGIYISEDGVSPTINTSIDLALSVKKTGTTNPQNISFTNLVDGIYFLHARALDAAGNWGNPAHYRFMVDTTGTPPIIQTTSPQGYVLTTTPILKITTDEQSVCYYSDDSENFTLFDTTGLLTHRQQLTLEERTYTYYFNCSDVGGRYNDSISTNFTIDLDAQPDALDILNNSNSIYKSQEVSYLVNLTKGGYSLIGFTNFTLTIDGAGEFFSYVDKQNGLYNFTFTAPNATGTFTLQIVGGPVSDTASLSMTDLELVISYAGATTTRSNLAYGKSGSTYVGFGCDQSGNPCATASGSVTSSGQDNAFVFFSNKLRHASDIDTQLNAGDFLDSESHKIGSISVDDYLIKTLLEYDYIILQGNESTSTGRYTLVLKNEGNDASGVPIISVDVK
jgi:nitrous oxidase accessory protein NosD